MKALSIFINTLSIFLIIFTAKSMDIPFDHSVPYPFTLHRNLTNIPNAIGEINSLANEPTEKNGHRPHNNPPDDCAQSTDTPPETVPFKPYINHTIIGYTALIYPVLDCFFDSQASLFPHEKEKNPELYIAHNYIHGISIINMFSRVHSVATTKTINTFRKKYALAKTVTSEEYVQHAQDAINPDDHHNFTLFNTYFMRCDGHHAHKEFSYAYRRLNSQTLDALLPLLLELYIFLEGKTIPAYKKTSTALPTLLNAFMAASATQQIPASFTDVDKACTTLLKKIHLLSDRSEQEPIKKSKCLMLHHFLVALDRYVRDLIMVRLQTQDSSSGKESVSTSVKKSNKQKLYAFLDTHKKEISLCKKVGITLFIMGLLYRIAKKNGITIHRLV